jgi:serine phosphatase RsbU (regulator of sigma subunit)
MRTYGWRSWRDALRELLIGATVGVAISLIESGGTREFPPLHTFIRNIIFGVVILACARGAETLLSRVIERSRWPLTLRTVLYTVAGSLGYFAGLAVVAVTIGADRGELDLSYHFFYSIVACAAISIAIGLTLHANRRRNERMRQIEFAEKELEIARDMQRRLLPPPLIEAHGWRVTARTRPAHIVGGDFYDVVRFAGGAIGIVIADVSGKGIAASLLMASCKAMIPLLAAGGDVAALMHALNAALCEQLGRREFVAMLCARFDAASGELEIVNAGMPDPYILDGATVRAIPFTGDRFPLGIRATTRYAPARAALRDGERLLMLSDGFPEAMAHGDAIGYERVEAMLRGFRGIDELLAQVSAIDGVRIDDDLTVVTLERR